ncbi:hypothetical protein [Parageobacillus thermoglucosidasius]|uniref:hypothetical protein n=1 Tax=Parageobacillus thermoglucosidasius TaxID=1426 RepID=UPI000E1965DC|nr:hypothetical protein [Parageobacillus thermoglucosidasius]MED4904129.1 hypothetical protein [Parageobacillus thermoglucosidasius]MED4915679.1 hypothetical protein [Parageobacillus thermoglucosidasius]MED4945056.1 hypothetical protein [Parageobacillus thermoglucosidasius]MED4983747.1 hypothetical protein [Parageobacillus thermoglucosidasius]RDE19314.1 hypothetical protein DV714_19965 [Parageobacillus thermoglucosidasius]
MPQQNGRLNTDLDNKLTSSYYDGAKWHMFIKALNADIEALGSTTDSASANTVIGLLKALIEKLPSALQNDAIKAVITAALPAGTNKIGQVDIANNPTVRVDSATPVNVNVANAQPVNVQVANNPTVQIDDSQPINVAINGGGSLDVNVTNEEPLSVMPAVLPLNVRVDSIDHDTFLQVIKVPPFGAHTLTKVAAAANTPEIIERTYELPGAPVEYVITASESNSGPIYIGGDTMGPTEGIKLAPGQQFKIEFGGDLYFSAENAGDQISVFISYIPPVILTGSKEVED